MIPLLLFFVAVQKKDAENIFSYSMTLYKCDDGIEYWKRD